MHLRLATLAMASTLGGCSLIYNPNNLPQPDKDAAIDAPPDVVLDADPSMLAVAAVTPASLDEGVGVDHARQTVVVLDGMQMVPGATVSIAAADGVADPEIDVDNANLAVAADGNSIAVPVTARINTGLEAGQTLALKITVSQPSGSGMTTATKDWTLNGYNQLTTGTIDSTMPRRYSQVRIAGGLTATGGGMINITSNSSISIGGTLGASGSGQTAGPGGCGGGANDTTAACGAGSGMAGGIGAGGGGGFGTAGGTAAGTGGSVTGDPLIVMLAGNKSAGGGGGTVGMGGGGGGSIMLTAAGDITLGPIHADGGNGSGNAGGGGGSGGLIVVRAGALLTASATAANLTANGGTGGSTNAGGVGRIRLDAATFSTPMVQSTPAAQRGVVIAMAPLITRTAATAVTVAGAATAPYLWWKVDSAGQIAGPTSATIGLQGNDVFTVDLTRGASTLCVGVMGAVITSDSATSCVQIVYVP